MWNEMGHVLAVSLSRQTDKQTATLWRGLRNISWGLTLGQCFGPVHLLLWTLVHPWEGIVCVCVCTRCHLLYICVSICQSAVSYLLFPWGTHVFSIVWEVTVINLGCLKTPWFVGLDESKKHQDRKTNSLPLSPLPLLLPPPSTCPCSRGLWTALVWSLGMKPSFSLITAWLEKQLLRAACLDLCDIDGSCRCRKGAVSRGNYVLWSITLRIKGSFIYRLT